MTISIAGRRHRLQATFLWSALDHRGFQPRSAPGAQAPMWFYARGTAVLAASSPRWVWRRSVGIAMKALSTRWE